MGFLQIREYGRGHWSCLRGAIAFQQFWKDGLGLALLPDWLIREDLKAGNIVSVLNEYVVNPQGVQPAIQMFYPENRKPMKKIRTFVDFTKGYF